MAGDETENSDAPSPSQVTNNTNNSDESSSERRDSATGTSPDKAVLESRAKLLRAQFDLEEEEFQYQLEMGERTRAFRRGIAKRRAELDQQLQGLEPPQMQPLSPVREATPTPSEMSGNAMNSLIKHLKRPVVEITKFSGDPLKYVSFMRQFKANVLPYCDDEGERMTLLMQYCEGEARQIVSSYSHLRDHSAYKASIESLEKRYGRSDVIAATYVSRALQWPYISPKNPKALDAYALFLREINSAIIDLNEVRTLEYPENMMRLVCKLPVKMHDQWRSIVYRKKEEDEPVKFNDLVRFVEKQAELANDPTYGSSAMSAIYTDDNKKAPTKKPAHAATAEVTGKYECLYCEMNNHTTSECFKLGKLDRISKTKFVKEKRLCFGCLKVGHVSVKCKSRSQCKKCKKGHPTSLHWDQSVEKRDQGSSDMGAGEDNPTCNSNTGFENEFCTMPIVPVVVSLKGQEVKTYAFIDSGSSCSFISEGLASKLKASGARKRITLNTLGREIKVNSKLVDGMSISDLSRKNKFKLPTVYSKQDIPVSQAHIVTNQDLVPWQHLSDVKLPIIKGEIGLLLGNNIPDICAH